MNYKRVLLKLSGEALAPVSQDALSYTCFDSTILHRLAKDIASLSSQGIEISIVIGGGNIYRGAVGEKLFSIDRTTSDYMGMLATMINALALHKAIENEGTVCRVISAIPMPSIAEPYIRTRAVRHLEKGRVVIFACGSGHPYFTTDTAAALRSLEMNADVLLKATNVDGVYSEDPKINPQADFYPTLSYDDVIQKRLKVMDATAFTMLRDHHMPLIVFSLLEEKSIHNALTHQGKFTRISDD